MCFRTCGLHAPPKISRPSGPNVYASLPSLRYPPTRTTDRHGIDGDRTVSPKRKPTLRRRPRRFSLTQPWEVWGIPRDEPLEQLELRLLRWPSPTDSIISSARPPRKISYLSTSPPKTFFLYRSTVQGLNNNIFEMRTLGCQSSGDEYSFSATKTSALLCSSSNRLRTGIAFAGVLSVSAINHRAPP